MSVCTKAVWDGVNFTAAQMDLCFGFSQTSLDNTPAAWLSLSSACMRSRLLLCPTLHPHPQWAGWGWARDCEETQGGGVGTFMIVVLFFPS